LSSTLGPSSSLPLPFFLSFFFLLDNMNVEITPTIFAKILGLSSSSDPSAVRTGLWTLLAPSKAKDAERLVYSLVRSNALEMDDRSGSRARLTLLLGLSSQMDGYTNLESDGEKKAVFFVSSLLSSPSLSLPDLTHSSLPVAGSSGGGTSTRTFRSLRGPSGSPALNERVPHHDGVGRFGPSTCSRL